MARKLRQRILTLLANSSVAVMGLIGGAPAAQANHTPYPGHDFLLRTCAEFASDDDDDTNCSWEPLLVESGLSDRRQEGEMVYNCNHTGTSSKWITWSSTKTTSQNFSVGASTEVTLFGVFKVGFQASY
ncbi:hypothetical protein ABZ532_30320 [Streptomyces sp. NPDC019396]|uniref:hypothetical protein n=1 Tax=Streptomyces sp. NPDC019396 TaxID=3154687 RepID=UPI0033F7C7E0